MFRQTFSEMSSGSLLQGYDVVVCEKCGFGYADRIPEQSAFDAYYRDMSKYEHQDKGGEVSEHDKARFRAVVNVVRPYLSDMDARLLDVGCATGQLLALFKESGFSNVTGLDPSAACARVARKTFDIRVLTGGLSNAAEIKASEPPFDFIILIGVLEHIRDLDSSLKGVRELLLPGGLVYVEVPDAVDFAGWPDAPFQQFSTEHINFFSAVSLNNLMTKFSFTPVSSQHIARNQSDNTVMPVVFAVFRRGGQPVVPSITRDTETERGLAGLHRAIAPNRRIHTEEDR